MHPDAILERTQWDTFWLPSDATQVDRPALGYTHCPRDQTYLNQVYRTRLSPDAVEAAIAEVVAAHAGRVSRWSLVPDSAPADLARHLEAAGYRRYGEHRGAVLPVDDWQTVHTGHTVRSVRTRAELEDLYAATGAAFGRDAHPGDAAAEAEVLECRDGSRVQRFVVYEGDRPVCGGGLNLYPELRFGFLWAGGTVPDARGRGAYRALLQARVQAARHTGLTAVGLYARTTTSLPIVQRLGFNTHGFMHSWDRPAS
ncbi:MAG: GNAT superfamily N-acetyltransferase [Myxococcota bacterium]|jgi:GNAT superfamily N-acetyltransferase